jgi:hypothetical protein
VSQVIETARDKHRTYGNWSQPRSPGIWGLGTIGTVVVILTPAAMVLAFLVSFTAGLVVGVVGALILLPVGVKIGGRTLGELMMVRAAFWRSRSRREHVYLSGPLVEPYGTHRLPGLLAKSELVEAVDGFGQSCAVVILPQSGHYTVILRLDPEGASLVDQEQVDSWVAGYGLFLAQLGHEPGLVGASVTIETAPDPGSRLTTAVESQRDPNAPALAQQVLDTIIETYPAGSAQVSAWCTLTYRSTGSRQRRGRDAMINHVASRLPTLADILRGSGAGAVRPMTPQEVAETVKIAYDPDVAVRVEQQRAQHQPTGITWANCGPHADMVSWDAYRHDSGISRVWSLNEAPRGTVLSSVLAQLLAPHGAIQRKRVTLTYRPHSPGEAAKIVDRDLRTAEFLKDGRRAAGTARDSRAIRAAAQAAAEEAEGAGLVRFSLFVSATVKTLADLDDVSVIMDGLAGTARIDLRPMFNGQRAGFAVTLPVGILLPEHVLIPSEVREAL